MRNLFSFYFTCFTEKGFENSLHLIDGRSPSYHWMWVLRFVNAHACLIKMRRRICQLHEEYYFARLIHSEGSKDKEDFVSIQVYMIKI